MKAKILGLLILTFFISLSEANSFAENLKAEEDPLIPREILFGNPDKVSVQISGDGKYISYLAPRNGLLNVYIAPVEDLSKATVITDDKDRGVQGYLWATNSKNIIYSTDNKGDENFRLYSIDIDTLEEKLLTPKEGVKSAVIKSSIKYPDEILVQINDRTSEYFDVYKVNVKTGNRELVFKNSGKFSNFRADDDLKIRLAYAMLSTGEGKLFTFEGNDYLKPKLIETIKVEDMVTTFPLVIKADGKSFYFISSRGNDKSALYEVDFATLKKEFIYQDKRADIEACLVDPTTKQMEAAIVNYMKKEWIIFDVRVKEHFEHLSKLHDGDLEIISRTKKDDKWVVAYVKDNGPISYYLYDLANKEAKFLFVSNQEQEKYKFAKMYPIKVTSKDGLELVSYLTLPRWLDKGGKLDKPIPLVLYVHGGPNFRDTYGYNPTHQWLANRGYAVLSVNYRGSTGFGKGFINAGDGKWAREMQRDLEDGVKWAIDNNIAEKDKVVIMGGSYGGYATLVGMTMTPDFYAAGIDIVGVSNLETFMKSIPPYWKPLFAHLKKMVGGDPDNEEGRKFLAERSPLNYVENIKKPLLIVQGANDPRVKQAESDQVVEAMKKRSIPVIYLMYKDEGHGFVRPENRLSFYAIAEIFLANILKGRYIKYEDNFPGSSVEIREGKNLLQTEGR